MMFNKLTLFCAIAVITSLSLMLIATVQIVHSPQVVINRDSGRILNSLRAARTRQALTIGEACTTGGNSSLLEIIVVSAKHNHRTRKAIRHTWGQRDERVHVKFVLTNHDGPSASADSVFQVGLRHHEQSSSPAAEPSACFVLITSDQFFVHVEQILDAIGTSLPLSGTVLCALNTQPRQRRSRMLEGTGCDESRPVLLTADMAAGASSVPLIAVRYGNHLFLSYRETQLIHDGSIDGSKLRFFFSSRLFESTNEQVSSIHRHLWQATWDEYAAVES